MLINSLKSAKIFFRKVFSIDNKNKLITIFKGSRLNNVYPSSFVVANFDF